jgi:hypothetical protein
MDNLQNGITAFRAGKRDEARKYFIAAMKEDPNNENVWGWLYQVAKNDSEKIQALSKVVALNPNNQQARELLNKLQAPPLTQEHTAAAKQIPQSNILQNKADPKQTRNVLIGFGSIILICLMCFCAYAFYDPVTETTDHTTMAFVICQLYVESMLKAPTTADFPASINSNIRELENNVYEIHSYVDAQNSFGAMIRTPWYCKVQYLGTPQDDDSQSRLWDLLELNLEE